MWQEQQLDGPSPNGGVLVIVHSDEVAGWSVITEYDARGLVIYRFEYERVDPDLLADGNAVRLTITDWDEQVVERRGVPAVPSDPISRERLIELLCVGQLER